MGRNTTRGMGGARSLIGGSASMRMRRRSLTEMADFHFWLCIWIDGTLVRKTSSRYVFPLALSMSRDKKIIVDGNSIKGTTRSGRSFNITVNRDGHPASHSELMSEAGKFLQKCKEKKEATKATLARLDSKIKACEVKHA